MLTSFTSGTEAESQKWSTSLDHLWDVICGNNHIPQINRPYFRKYLGSSQSKNSLYIYMHNNKRLHPQPSARSLPVFPPGVLCSSSIGSPLLICRLWT